MRNFEGGMQSEILLLKSVTEAHRSMLIAQQPTHDLRPVSEEFVEVVVTGSGDEPETLGASVFVVEALAVCWGDGAVVASDDVGAGAVIFFKVAVGVEAMTQEQADR